MNSPSVIEGAQPVQRRQQASPSRVGDLEAELEQHIHDCGLLLERAYARFEAHRNPVDRDEALFWWAAGLEAIRSRSAATEARRHAEFERRLDEGVDYFAVQGARARAAMEGIKA